jgi:hypothetical protein
MKWTVNLCPLIKTMLITNLLPNSILVIDNASYHNIQTDKLTSNSKKDEMKAWLLERNIPFCDSMLTAKLYDLMKLNKPMHKCCVINQISADKGHTVLKFDRIIPI